MTTTQPEAESRTADVGMPASPPRKDRDGKTATDWFVVVVVGLIAAAVGVGAGYLLFAQDSDGGTNDEVEALLDDFYAAVNAGDVEALREMSTDDATVFGLPVASGNTLTGGLENIVSSTGGIERIDDAVVAQQGWRFRVAQQSSSTMNSADDDAILLIIIVDSGSVNAGGDGTEQELKIASVDPYNF
ncbi:MAG: hypothetical protein WCA29_00945 [Jiangellales bacterium]